MLLIDTCEKTYKQVVERKRNLLATQTQNLYPIGLNEKEEYLF